MDKQLPAEYLKGIVLFNEERFFEAHEAWEEIWLKSQGTERVFYQGLIQAAATLLKFQEGRQPQGAERLYNLTLQKLSEVPDHYLGLDVRKFEGQLKIFFEDSSKIPKIVLGPP